MSRERLLLVLTTAVAAGAVAPLWLPTLLPFPDYPQHLAQLAMLRHIGDPAWGFADQSRCSLLTPYAGAHLVAWPLAALLGDDAAMRVVFSLAVSAVPFAAASLYRALGRSPELALATAPFAYAWVTWTGLVPFAVVVPMVLWGTAVAARQAEEPDVRRGIGLATLAVVTFAFHAFGLALLGVFAGAVALACRSRPRCIWPVAAPFVPAAVLLAAWTIVRVEAPHGGPWGTDFATPIRLRLQDMGVYVLGGESGWDARRMATVAALLLFAGGATAVARRAGAGLSGLPSLAPTIALFGAGFLLYLFLPRDLLGTSGVFARVAPFWPVFLLGLADLPLGRSRFAATLALAVPSLVAAGFLIARTVAFDARTHDLPAVLAQAPRAKILHGVTEGPNPFGEAALRHAGAYYQVMRGGVLTYSFARFPHQPCTLRAPDPGEGAADLLLLRNELPPPAPSPSAKLLAAQGGWWLFEAR